MEYLQLIVTSLLVPLVGILIWYMKTSKENETLMIRQLSKTLEEMLGHYKELLDSHKELISLFKKELAGLKKEVKKNRR